MRKTSKQLHYGLLLLLCWNHLFLLAQQPVKVACIGNSVTFGYTHKHPQLTSYPAQLQKLLGEKYLVKNFGHTGTTLLRKGYNPYFKTKEFEEALAFYPDIAIIHLGLNDTDPRNWPDYKDDFAPDYAWLIDTIRKNNPAVKIFICRLTPIFSDHPRFISGTRDWFWQIQELIPHIAKANKTGIIDLHTPLYSRPDLFQDALHPNIEGAAILAKTVFEKITGDFGGLQLATVFAPHMVLQRNKPIRFYGKANTNEKVSIRFNQLQKTVEAADDGRWQVVFPAMKAGGPFTANFITAEKAIRLDDILIGEVWLCSGQSNMYFPLRDAIHQKDEMELAQKSTTLRLLKMNPVVETGNYAWDSVTLQNVNQLNYFSGTWQKCDSEGVKDFSAVAYYFGKKLQRKLHVPVGLIEVAVGGSTAESWIDRYTMEHHPVLVNELYNWRQSDFFMSWVRERAATNLKNATNPKQRHPYEPCYNYEAGIKPLVNFPVAGVIWYQGESNTHNTELYETVFPELVNSWRKQWGYSLPFYYVQLSSMDRPSWTSFRFSQLQLVKRIPNVGMAVSSDAGNSNNVHPKQKKVVGIRLAVLALHFTYGQKNIVPYGPMPAKAVMHNGNVVFTFQYAKQLQTSDGKPLRGFKLMDEKGIQYKAHAFIEQNKVVIRVPGGMKPINVLYAWESYTNANLINGARLPASTFKFIIE